MMEEPIGKLCNTVAKFCNHLETSCSALKQCIERPAIPFDSASTTFVTNVNRRVSAAAADLNMLESMSFATVSFEELLGHCNEVLKKNENDLFALQDHLRFSSGSTYISPLDFDDKDVEQDHGIDKFELKNDDLEEHSLLDESLSLKKFGISDVSLARIASHGDSKFEVDEPEFQPHIESSEVREGDTGDELVQVEDFRHLLHVTRADYESLPKYMQSLVSWEDLQVAVKKMNSCVQTKETKPDTFSQDEIESLDLGFKTRSHLLLLIKMNRLSVETNEGVISYRIL